MSLEHLTGPRSSAKRKSNTVVAGRTAGPAVVCAEADPSQLYIPFTPRSRNSILFQFPPASDSRVHIRTS